MNLILFDLDGTLYSSRTILPDAYARGIDRFNEEHGHSVAVPTEEQIFDQVGNPVDEIYGNLFPDLSDHARPHLQNAIFSVLLEKIQRGKGRLFEGVKPVLEQLGRHRPLGIVTNAQTQYMRDVLDTHELEDYFRKTLCNDDAPNGKKSELVDQQLRAFDAAPGETLLVGDRDSDREAADAHGVHFVGCTFGYGSSTPFNGRRTIDSFGELPEVVEELTSG